MNKVVLILLTLTVVVSCNDEPVDTALLENSNDGNGGGTDSDDLTLLRYELDTQINTDFFGTPTQTNTNSVFNVSNDMVLNGTSTFSTNGSPFVTETQTITRNADGFITNDVSVNASGNITNQTTVTYTNNQISQITYAFTEDSTKNYTYNFTYNQNVITRNIVDSDIRTEFTLDSNNRIVKKESFDSSGTIQSETVTYDASGNAVSSVTTGETENNSTYTYDTNTNPLQKVYNNNYLLTFLNDDYSDEIGPLIAQFFGLNNWNGATFNGESFSFNLTYNTEERIETRDINFDFGSTFSTSINERFFYIN